MSRSTRSVGAHVSVAGDLRRAVERAEQRGCDALQVFPSNPRAWAVPSPDAGDDAALGDALRVRRWPLFLHAPYLVNLASGDPELHRRSVENVAFALRRGARLGARAVVVHPGSGRGDTREEAVAHTATTIRALLDRVPGIELCLELPEWGEARSVSTRWGASSRGASSSTRR